MHVLVSGGSRYGSTAEIAQVIAKMLQSSGFTVTVAVPGEVGPLAPFDAAVLGSAVYTGHWLAPALKLAHRVGTELPGRPIWLFSSGPVGNPTRKLVQKMWADPVDLPGVLKVTGARAPRMFAGKLDRHSLAGLQRAVLFFFRGLEGDFRDWPAIRSWAQSVADELVAVAGR